MLACFLLQGIRESCGLSWSSISLAYHQAVILLNSSFWWVWKRKVFIALYRINFLSFLIICLLVSSRLCAQDQNPYLYVLGVAQDAEFPQVGCYAPHCMKGWNDPSERITPTAIAVIDADGGEHTYLKQHRRFRNKCSCCINRRRRINFC